MIIEAKSDDAVRMGSAIAAAFADDPVNQWVFGRGRMAPTFGALARHLYLKRGFGHLAGEDNRASGGAALWLMDARDKEAAGLLTTLQVASVLGVTAGLGAMRRGLAIDAAFTHAHPAERHAFLFAIGVVPAAQGKGVGGALLRAGLERVDAAHLPCYLESTKQSNVALYRHFGFEELPMMASSTAFPQAGPGVLPAGCPPIWPMWRVAR